MYVCIKWLASEDMLLSLVRDEYISIEVRANYIFMDTYKRPLYLIFLTLPMFNCLDLHAQG